MKPTSHARTQRIAAAGAVDEVDAKRIIGAAVQLAALPNIMSAEARLMASVHLRGVMTRNPSSAPLLGMIVQHLEAL